MCVCVCEMKTVDEITEWRRVGRARVYNSKFNTERERDETFTGTQTT